MVSSRSVNEPLPDHDLPECGVEHVLLGDDLRTESVNHVAASAASSMDAAATAVPK